MACQNRTFRIDPQHSELTKPHAAGDCVSELLQSLRSATGAALSRLEQMAQDRTPDYLRAVRELKLQQRRLRSARQNADAQAQ